MGSEASSPAQVEVAEVVINLDGKRLRLTPDQARKLYAALRLLLAEPSVMPIFPHVINPAPIFIPVPVYPAPESPTYVPPWTVTCGATGVTACASIE
jgi:hypothetical protein